MAPPPNSARASVLDTEGPANADAAAYSAGGDTYHRSRTYSSVRIVFSNYVYSPHFDIVATPLLRPQTCPNVPRGLTHAAQKNVPWWEECDESETLSCWCRGNHPCCAWTRGYRRRLPDKCNRCWPKVNGPRNSGQQWIQEFWHPGTITKSSCVLYFNRSSI